MKLFYIVRLLRHIGKIILIIIKFSIHWDSVESQSVENCVAIKEYFITKIILIVRKKNYKNVRDKSYVTIIFYLLLLFLDFLYFFVYFNTQTK